MAAPLVLIVGNSDGIGLALTRRLLARGQRVLGLSRRPSPIEHDAYRHVVVDVTDPNYGERLEAFLENEPIPNAVFYCAGIGERTRPDDLSCDYRVFDVNLMGAVRTAQCLLPRMLESGGKFVVLSSMADVIVNHEAPSYTASKAALSTFFEGLGLSLRKTKVEIVCVRFGFVDTKLARSGRKPFIISTEHAARRLEGLLEKRAPLRVTYPRRMAVLVAVVAFVQRWRVRWA